MYYIGFQPKRTMGGGSCGGGGGGGARQREKRSWQMQQDGEEKADSSCHTLFLVHVRANGG